MVDEPDRKIAGLDKEITRSARENKVARRLMNIPAIGSIKVTVIGPMALLTETFQHCRGFGPAHYKDLQETQQSLAGHQGLANLYSGDCLSAAVAP
ncbi:hypothetical protein [Novosphingobium sp. 9]|uniref:hypothetical protein n=1 Tax=Novosphingobium sp. 9 TaxID=2025349 RepID=UPI0021B652A8|nr:hypothetical protein [Novosphingobium sp. 9]